MSGSVTVHAGGELAFKIAKLVEERGWNQEDFARISNLNRHTIRQILNGGPKRRLRNATVSQCADALGLTVNELRTLPIDRLLPRMHGKPPADEEALKMLFDRAALPELVNWLERNKDRATELRADEITELLEAQNPGGVLEKLGVEPFVEFLERRRALVHKVYQLANSEYVSCLETFVGLLFEKVQSTKR
ncbi:helix-turn-helix transcriptional regulator [Limnoglobus roseus]|uniref:XRE family transcriptional regulator n=1 Tax=Limnoglobus roseus TaxID=2598579 RepID=A0A5C1A4G2_9BACT|nr:helix-turn-helix transcriptional regulator [Limnoglobus roseus]QEL13979.1 XRE family transcriptional regulator [Limnoglobus roseus]